MNDQIRWWGYLHNNGSIHTKRYFDVEDILEAEESSFVKEIMPPFPTENEKTARKIVIAFFEGDEKAEDVEDAFTSYWEKMQPVVKEQYRQFYIRGAYEGVGQSLRVVQEEKL